MNALLTPEQLAGVLQRSVHTLAKWRQRNQGPQYIRLNGKSVAYSPDAVELGWAYVERYIALRAAVPCRIGAIWPGRGGVYWLAPAGAFDSRASMDAIPVTKLKKLIDELDPPQIKFSENGALAPPSKFPVQSDRTVWFGVRRRA